VTVGQFHTVSDDAALSVKKAVGGLLADSSSSISEFKSRRVTCSENPKGE
jgi:hypothetical protein